MSNPNLAMIPSGYNAANAKLYSILPSDGSGDFTVSVDADATRVNKDGLIEGVALNQARLTYDPLNPECPSLLLEPTRTNFALNSDNTFLMSVIGGSENATRTENYSTSPRGTLIASRLQASITSGTSNYSLVGSSTTNYNGFYTASIYLKSNTGDEQQVAVYGRNSPIANYTVTKDWKRFSFYGYNSPGQTAFINVGILGQISGSSTEIDISLFGVQIEQENYQTSLITTQATAVTRTNDVCGNAGDADLFDGNEGTMFVDIQKAFKGSNSGSISISDGSNNNRVVIAKQSNNTQFRMFIARVSSGNIIAQLTLNINFDVQNKLAITFKFGEFKFYVNGVLSSTETPNEDIPIGLSKFAFNENNLGSQDFFGEINDVRYYNTVLTEAEAIKLTT